MNMEARKNLNWLNYLNLTGYLLNVCVNYFYGMGSQSDEDIGSVSDNYQTIVSPSGWAFSIWGVIFIMQGVFAVVQLLPRFRANVLVQDGVKYYYALACIFQSGWVFAFTNHVIWLSLVLIILIWASLLAIMVCQYYTKYGRSHMEYWLLCFPFSIHFGWITAASLLNANVLLVSVQGSVSAQLAMGIITLAILHAVSVYTLFGINKPEFVFSLVFVWATGAIASELSNPDQSIVFRFDDNTIQGIEYAAIAVCAIIMTQIVLSSLIVPLFKKYILKSAVTDEREELELVTALPTEVNIGTDTKIRDEEEHTDSSGADV